MHAKFGKTLLSLVIALFVATGMVACGDDDFVENQNQETENQNQETENQNQETENQNQETENQNQETENQNQGEEDGIAVAGEWETQFDTTEVIDEEMWSYMHLIDYDNGERWAITQNPDDDEHNPNDYNRIQWTPLENDVFYYCIVGFGLETEDDAREFEGEADENDLDGQGCGGFAWTEMTRQ